MTNAWDDLPNAKHIDRVLAHTAAHPKNWDAAWDAARDAAWDAVRDAAWDAARCLIAWDDCGYILDLPPDVVRTLAGAGNHAAVLLLPAVIAMYEGD
ncbi:MAG: hypothetical protein EHM17_17260 [Verrucomicrobiaceae bacterium]|nr:MAG: hypothetical protein EHM17_17260 [Verrucomicrobiaceae bacterium]